MLKLINRLDARVIETNNESYLFPCCRFIMFTAPNNILRSLLDEEKLNETNFLDWARSLRIVLKIEKKDDVLETLLAELLLTMPLKLPKINTKSILMMMSMQHVSC